MLSVGALIWISVRPLLRLIICAGFGFAITKAGIFPLVAARGAGQIMLNIAFPCLMFSKIIPAFTPENIGALGPLILMAVLYETLGLTMAWIIKQIFWVPHRFRYGILVAGGWSNYGDIPTAVIMSVTGSAPFNSSTDQTLSVAYISAFLLVFLISLFPMGGHRLVAWDYDGPDVEDNEVRMSLKTKVATNIGHSIGFARYLQKTILRTGSRSLSDLERPTLEYKAEEPPREKVAKDDRDVCITSHQLIPLETISPAHTETVVSGTDTPVLTTTQPATLTASAPLTRRILTHTRAFTVSLLNPPALAILIALPLALITPLKALFVPVAGAHIPPAPDGQPPLAFVLDTATFVGGASIPLGLICLGSALARLRVPRAGAGGWRRLPLGAIGALAAAKMLLAPVLGVLVTQALVAAGVVAAEDRVLRFVCIFFSCVPTATTQVFLTQVYSGTGDAEHLSAFLIPQYAIMLVSMTALTAYTLQLLF